MTDTIHIEPADRSAFAVWALGEWGDVATTSTGFTVTVDRYPSIPQHLLAGAVVDGYPYVGEVAVPASEPAAPVVDRLPQAPSRKRTRRRPTRAAEGAADA